MFNLAEELFNTYDFFNGLNKPTSRQLRSLPSSRANLVPISVGENEGSYVVKALMPGFLKEEVAVSVEDNVLTITAEKTGGSKESEELTMLLNEVPSISNYSRKVKLPKPIDTDTIKAAMDSGILTVTLLKKSVLNSKRILIE